MRKRFYVGRKIDSREYEVFKSESEPTTKEWGAIYLYSIGPFHRKMDAQDFVDHNHYSSGMPIISTSFRACKPEN